MGHPVHQKLKVFYKKYPTPELATSDAAYNDWMGVVSHLPFVKYSNSTKDMGGHKESYVFLPGFSVDSALTQNLAAKNIGIVHQEGDCILYELETSQQNLSMIFDKLFGLDVIKNDEKELISALNGDSTQKHLKDILAKLGFKNPTVKNPLVLRLEKKKPYNVNISLIYGHGEVSSERLPVPPIQALESISAQQLQRLDPSISFLLSEEKFKKIATETPPERLLMPFFAQRINDPHRLVEIGFRATTNMGVHPNESLGSTNVKTSIVGKFASLNKPIFLTSMMSLKRNPNADQRVLAQIELIRTYARP